jgi:hypothetical protein
MDDQRVDRMFFGPETVKTLKRDVRDLTALVSEIDNEFERKMCEQILKGKRFLLEQEKCLEEKRKA